MPPNPPKTIDNQFRIGEGTQLLFGNQLDWEARPKALSKSSYTAFRQCPKNLWLKIYKPEEAVEDPSLEARLEQGNEVGDLAMQYFGNFVEVTTYKNKDQLDLPAMVRKTQQCMQDGVENICEASFDYKGNYCAVDILHKDGCGWAIYEVKSTSAEPG